MMDQLKADFETLAQQAQKDGVELEMLVTGAESLSLSFQNRKLDNFDSSNLRVAGLRVVQGSTQGYASTENLSLESLTRTYREARDNAAMLKETSTGPAIPLATHTPLTDEMKDLFRDTEIPIEKKIELTRQMEEQTFAKDSRVHRVPYLRFSESKGWKRILNSKGLDRFFQSSAFSGYTYPMAKEGETTKLDGESFFERDFEKINVEELTSSAVKRATSRLGAKKLKTGLMPVLIDREIAGNFLSMLTESLSGKGVLENKSFFKDKQGQSVAPAFFTLTDDPFDRRGTAARPFDSEGSPSQKTVLIGEGKLQNFMTNLDVAQRLKCAATGNASRGPSSEMGVGPSNWVVSKGLMTREQMLKSAPRLLWLTEVGALHSGFRAASGDFSLPAEGFLVENGQVVGAVDQFVLSGNILEVLKKLSGVGDTYNKAVSNILIPDLLISELSVAGES